MCRRDSRATRPRRSESGQGLVITGLAMAALMGAVGLAVDVGYLRYTDRRMQTAADAAAVAAAAELNYSDYMTAGQTDASSNGFTNGSNNVTVAVNTPPTKGAYAGQPNYVEVIITDSVPTFFMRVLGTNSEAISARAVAHEFTGNNCIYALSPNASNAIYLGGSASVPTSCGIVDDSNASDALHNGGSGSLTASAVSVSGGWTSNGGGTITPTPSTNVPPEPDPLGYLPEPSVGSCTYSSKVIVNSSVALGQGVYCGGIKVNGGGSVTFGSGLYIINGGELTIAGGAAASGTDVTFYITGGASVTVNGGSTTTLVAPTSGTYAGVLFFQDRTDSSAATVTGTSGSTITGTLYFPDAALTYSGNSSITAYNLIVASTVSFSGNATVNNDYSSLSGGSPIQSATLAE